MDRLESLQKRCEAQQVHNEKKKAEMHYQEERFFDLKVRTIVAEELVRVARESALREAGIPIKRSN